MRVPSTLLRLATLLFLGSVPLALAGCGDEPTSPGINAFVIGPDIGGGGGGGGTNPPPPPPPSAPSVSYALTPSAPDGENGWYRSNVSLAWTISYNTADEPTYVGCEEPTVADDQEATDYPCSATNSVGTTGPVSASIKRDATPPEVKVTGVTDGATYVEGAVPEAGCTTTDPTSGVATEATLQVSGGPIGAVTVACIGAKDNAGNIGSTQIEYQVTAAPVNQPPVAAAGGPYTGVEGNAITLTAAASSDPDVADVLSFAWDTDNDGQYDDATGPAASVTYPDNGAFTVGVRVTDSKGASSTATATVNVSNANPSMTFSAPATVGEGTAIALSASGKSDAAADQGSLQVTYSCDGGTTFSTAPVCPAVDGPATVNVVGRVADKDGGSTDYPKTVNVTNAAPVITSLTLPTIPVAMGTLVSLAASFSDPWADDGHTAEINWDDASASLAVSVSTPGSVSATHTYSAPGVYTVTLTVRDDAGAGDTEQHQYVVVYDPSAGFVTGAGWIAYGATACPVLCGGAAGRGEFGFVSRYQKGATLPAGDTQFDFYAGTLRFESTEYEWLVVAGSRAQFKGRGRINGSGDYGFLVTAIDGATDAFRIKIWNRATSVVAFDNQWGADETGPAATLLDKVHGNGSIVVRAK